jgi:hypothetical protein
VRDERTGRGLRIGGLLLLPLLAALSGCKAAALPWLLWGEEPTKNIAAEYPYLAEKRVCIVVRADMDTLVEYPQVQLELADHVQAALEANIQGLRCVDPRKVVDYQREKTDWDKEDPAVFGKHFQADRLLELDLTQYTTREPESPYLYRGHVAALLNIYNTAYPNSAPAYSKEVAAIYPPDGPGEWGSTDRDIRRGMMQAFAEEVAGKFYDRKVKVK